MKKIEFAREIAEITGDTYKASSEFISVLKETLINAIKNDGEADVKGLGVFKTTIRKARRGRNPSTGEEIQIPDKKIIKFKPYKEFKDNVNK